MRDPGMMTNRQIELVQNGMMVVDARGKEVGRVEWVEMGDPEAMTVENDALPDVFRSVAEAASDHAGEPQLPEPIRTRFRQHGFFKVDGPGLMDRMAATRPPGLRLVACLARGAGPEVPGLLVGSLGVDQLLFHPLDPDELARAVARITGVALPVQEGEAPAAPDPMSRAVSRIWGRHRDQNLERIAVLEEARR